MGVGRPHSEPYLLLVWHVVALDFSCGPLLGAVCAALPWIIFYFGGRDLYLHVLVGFALIMMFLNPRELLVKRRTGEQPAVEGIEENRSV
jgi:hypothetical protein